MLTSDDPAAGRMSGASSEDLAAALRWQWDMGVDLAVGDAPRDHFAEARARKALAPQGPAADAAVEAPSSAEPTRAVEPDDGVPASPRSARTAPRLAPEPMPIRAAAPQGALPPEEALAQARAVAAEATSLEDLRAALEAFDGCALKRAASHCVFAEGESGARIMFVGDMPADQDDREGRPFSGAAGAMLDRMLRAIGLDRTKVHLANAIPWRPPGKRQPSAHEIPICLTFLQRYIELARPEIVVTLGDLPARNLLGAREPIIRARGKWFDLPVAGSHSVPAIAMLHPDYLLKAPGAKRHAWADLRALKAAMTEKGLA